jgi:hypothetical protein
VTLTQLRSLCLKKIQNLQPTNEMPDVDADIRRSIRKFTESVGGIFRTKTLTTVANQREYTIYDAFPEDFIKSVRMIRTLDGSRIYPMSKWDRNDSATSTGTPGYYYIPPRSRLIGFDLIPNDAITISWDYFGKGDDVSEDDDMVLEDLPIMDDDPLWDGIVYEFAFQYFETKLLGEESEKSILLERKVDRLKRDGARARLAARGFLNSYNADMMSQIEQPDWMNALSRGYNSSLLERIGNEGDVIRTL